MMDIIRLAFNTALFIAVLVASLALFMAVAFAIFLAASDLIF